MVRENKKELELFSLDENYFCKPICNKSFPYEIIHAQICVNKCNIESIVNHSCIVNYQEKQETTNFDIFDNLINDIEELLTSEDYNTSEIENGNNEVIKYEHMTVTLTTTKNEKNDENNENINIDNYQKNKYNSYNTKNKKQKSKITSKELDEIEKMFRDIDDPKENYNTFFVGKKRNRKKEVAPIITDPKNYYHDIQELLKNYSLDNDEDKNKIDLNNIKGEQTNEENKKKKRGRKKKIIKENNESSESNADVDYLVPEKNDGYSKFKEFKELKKKMNNREYGKYSDEEEIDDDIDSDL